MNAFWQVEEIVLYSHLLRVFIRNVFWDFAKCIFCIYEMIIWFFCFWVANMTIHTDLYLNVDLPWIPGINTTLMSCIILFMYWWIGFAKISFILFTSVFVRNINVWFSCNIFDGFDIKVMLNSEWLRNILHSSLF